SEALSRLGYKRETPSTPRLTPTGEPLVLKILTETEKDGLIEKVLADSFASVGIAVEFIRTKPGYPHVHGVLTGLRVDWPRVNFLPHLGTNEVDFPLFVLEDTKLQQAMQASAATLSSQKPNFDLLQTVHERMYELEPFTVLMQHKSCLDVEKSMKDKVQKIDVADPDWFRKLLR